MLTGREYEYAYLKEYMKRPGSQLLVFYGQRFVGKTGFLLDFCKERPFYYWLCVPGCDKKAVQSLKEGTEELIRRYPERKKIFVLDEFQNLIKAPELIPLCMRLLDEEEMLIVFVSSAVSWVENSLVRAMGRTAAGISAFYKCRELAFADICRIYPGYNRSWLYMLYCVFGGFPGLWRFFDPKADVRENICRAVLSERSHLRHVGYHCFEDGMRESGVYDTILAGLAAGETKLNMLHLSTGYERAKISVYLKALMEMEQIEKLYSVSCPGSSNARKGIYEITNHFTAFWFAFVYPHQTELVLLEPEVFYDRFIRDGLAVFCDRFYRELAAEYLRAAGRMPEDPKSRAGRFLGKKHSIGLLWEKDGRYCTLHCSLAKTMLTYEEDYLGLLEAEKEAGITAAERYLVTGKMFDEKITLEAKMKQNLHLVTFDGMMEAFDTARQ